MATVNRVYILIAFILSAIASIFNFVSIGTEEWITGSTVSLSAGGVNYVHYGLFQGTYKRIVPFSTTYQLTMTCSFKNNICALLCGLDAEERETLLDGLFTNTYDPSYAYANCSGISKFTDSFRSFESMPVRANSDTYVTSKSFINAGVWLSTLLFVILAALLGLWTSVLALVNTVHNPYQYFLSLGFESLQNTYNGYYSVQSLFFYNGIAFVFTLLSMVVWGTMYNLLTFHNVSIYDTIVGSMSSDKTAYLGYSYWIGFISLALYAGSIAILYYREYLNERDPKQQKVTLQTDAADPTLQPWVGLGGLYKFPSFGTVFHQSLSRSIGIFIFCISALILSLQLILGPPPIPISAVLPHEAFVREVF